jgi:branched-chain amino acid transport system ATP-binding protein
VVTPDPKAQPVVTPAPKAQPVVTPDPKAQPVVTAALSVEGLVVGYGPVTVCRGIDLQLAPDDIGLLVGTNGAGKSTLLRALAGLVPAAGTVRLFGEDISRRSAEQRARRGLVLAPGGNGTFASLTVEESLALGAWTRRPKSAVAVEEALTLFPSLAAKRRQRTGTLSAGEQQLVVLARAIVAHPRVLVVDELTLGLSAARAEEVVAVLAGRAPVLLVDQGAGGARAVATRAWFLERGEIRFTGTPAELAERRDLLRPVLLR